MAYNKNVLCIKSGDNKDVVVGKIYRVRNGLLYTEMSPSKREQEIDYENILDLNLCEKRYGNEFIEIK